MCDVVKSRNKDQKQLIKELKQTVLFINRKYSKDILSPLTITLGDEFQGIIKNVESGLSIIIEIEEYIIKKKFDFKLRYVFNVGDIDTQINAKVAHEMLGVGLTETRTKLNQLKSTDNRINVSMGDEIISSVINNSFVVLDNIINKWDIEDDYEIASTFLEYIDYKIVAEKLHRNRSLIWKREKTLNIRSYRAVKDIIQQAHLLAHL
jgi:hypothetical protein